MHSNGTVKSYEKINDTSLGGELEYDDYFAISVTNLGDLDEDGVLDLAVGTTRDDDGKTDAGAVYILFMHSNGSVKSYTKINDTSLGGGLKGEDYFGTSITNIGDLDGDGIIDLAVGARRDDDGGTDKGAVYILFMNADGSTKSYEKINTTSVGNRLDNNDNLGSSVSNIGDLDGDGIIDLAVGAHKDDDGLADKGAIYILFMSSNGSVKSYEKINDTSLGGGIGAGDFLGSSVYNVGDLNNDGVIDLAVGAKNNDDGGPKTGAIWLIYLEDGYSSVINKQNSYQIRANSTHVKVGVNASSLISSIDSGWNHVALTSNTTSQSLYVNGELSSTTSSGTITSNVYDVYIGKYFNGTIDEPRIWNRSFSASEISQLYKSNLYKINSTAWSFYSNQAGLFDGNYNYFYFIKDSYGTFQSAIGEAVIDYLMNDVFMTAVTENSILISMVFKENMDAYIEYGTSSENYTLTSEVYKNQTANESLEITLENLDESTRYYFRFRVRGNLTGEDYVAFDEHNFTTRRREGESFSFVHMTDTHLGKDLQPYFYNSYYVSIINNILSSIAGSGADFVMDTGDTGQTHVASFAPTYHAQNQSDANERYSLVRNYFENISLPVYLSLGNHDAENGWGAEGTNSHSEDLYTWSLNARLDYWPGPTDQTYSYGGGPYENYYAFDWGDATFIILDSYRYNTVAPVTGDDWVLGDEQMAWLEETLSVSDKKWKFLFAHHILGGYDPDTSHGYNYGDGGGNYSWKGDQANINYLMEKYNAQFYLYGHVHRFVHDWANWSSFNRINQVNYIANMGGSWGGSFVCGGGKRQTIYQEGDCNRGYIKVDVSPYNVTFFFINGSNEALLYNYTISNTAPTVSLVSPIGEVTYGDFTFDYQDAEYDNGKDCTLYIDDLPRIIEHGTRAGVDTTFTFTDLIEGSYHNWSVNCSDGAFSSVSETKRFMYMVDRTISPTYSPTLTELIEGYEEDLKEDQSIIFEVNGKKHSLKLEKISGDEVTITISSDPQTFNMTINETKKVNVNEDNYYDLKIFLKDIRGSFVDLTVQTIHEEILVEEQEEREENKVEKSKLWYWLIVGAVVLIIAGIIVYLTNYKKKSK